MKARSAAKITVPVAVIGVLVSLLIWLSNLALANEHRVTKCETVDEVMMDIREDVKDIRYTQIKMMLEIQHLRDTKMDE